MIYENLLKFRDILAANKTKENLADKLDVTDRRKIATACLARAEKDKVSMEPWLRTVEKGLELFKNEYKAKIKAFEDSYNIQHPLLSHSVISVSSRIFTEIHREIYVASPNILGFDEDQTKQLRTNKVKHYIQQVLVDAPGSGWLDSMSKMYPKFALMGTQIKQVNFDPSSMRFYNCFIPYNDIYIHAKSESLEKAPAITKCVYMPQNDIIEKINSGRYIPYDTFDITNVESTSNYGNTGNYSDGTTMLYDRTYLLYEQHCWLDLDGDGYSEPYIVVIDKERTQLLRLVPRIKEDYSDWVVQDNGSIKIIRLEAEQYFVDFHYMSDPDGGFWSIGLAHMLGPINCIVNELMNNMANVATIATRQGGLVGLGARNTGNYKIDMTKYNFVPANMQALKDAMLQFDIKDPSPVIQQLTQMLIETGEKIGALNEALSGEMPSRELPAQTMLMIVEQSLKNAQKIYRQIKSSITKELVIVSETLYDNANSQHYQQFFGDQTADIRADFDPSSMDLSMNSDSSASSTSERIMKLQVLVDLLDKPQIAPFINAMELITRFAKVLDIQDEAKLIQQPPAPQPDPSVLIAEHQLMHDEEKRKDQKELKLQQLQIQQQQTASQVVVNLANAAKAKASAENEANRVEIEAYQHVLEQEKFDAVRTQATREPTPTQPVAE